MHVCSLFARGSQLAYAIAVTALPSEFTMMVPSSDPAHPFDVKTVKNWCALVYLMAGNVHARQPQFPAW